MSDDATEDLTARPAVGRIFETSRRVRLGDCSAGGRLRLDACARYLQDIANDDSRDANTPNPTAWVARRTTMRIEHFHEYLDMVSLATWCSGTGPRWAERRYTVGGRDGSNGLVEAVTLWVHIDMATMKPVALPTGFADHFGASAGGRTVSARLHLPTQPPADVGSVADWPLRFVDFDVLGHVNNSVYWAIVEEQLARLRDVRAPLEVALEHHAAISPGARVSVRVVDAADGFDLWVTTDDSVAAVVLARSGAGSIG
ncbi:MAG TPA: acyl-ACP thioesterase domain-containing protein [Ilumatobacteraceae bacterium]